MHAHFDPGQFIQLADGSHVSVPLMHQTAEFGYSEDSTLQVLEMVYAGGELSLVVLLPREPDGLAQLENRLSPPRLAAWFDRLIRKSSAPSAGRCARSRMS